MDKKAIYAIVVVAILIVAAVAVYVMVSGDDEDHGTPSEMEDAELKIYGNINGDRHMDSDDVALIQQLIDDGKTAADYPLADANQDGVLDSKDIDVVNAVIEGRTTTLWHINYHDVDGDSTMDEELVSTVFPIKSCIITASANTSMALFTLGIIDQVKGASYSSSSMDSALYSDCYLNTDKVVKLGTSATKITFEDGKAGSSDVIAKEGVTALITDWNRSYITNEADFEKSGIDVVRAAASSNDPEVMTHSILLFGLLFQCSERAEDYLNLLLEIRNYTISAVEGADPVKFVACSSTGAISGPNSDYTQVCTLAGGVYALDNKIDFGGSTSLPIADHPEVYANYDFDYIIHLRTSVNYSQSAEGIAKDYKTYTDAFSDWKNADTGQYMVSGSIPSPLRIAYVASVFHSDLVDMDKVNEFHQELVDKFYNGLKFDVSEMSFVVGPNDL